MLKRSYLFFRRSSPPAISISYHFLFHSTASSTLYRLTTLLASKLRLFVLNMIKIVVVLVIKNENDNKWTRKNILLGLAPDRLEAVKLVASDRDLIGPPPPPSWCSCKKCACGTAFLLSSCWWTSCGVFPEKTCNSWSQLGVFSFFSFKILPPCCQRVMGDIWLSDISPKITCSDEEAFCTSDMKCDDIEK